MKKVTTTNNLTTLKDLNNKVGDELTRLESLPVKVVSPKESTKILKHVHEVTKIKPHSKAEAQQMLHVLGKVERFFNKLNLFEDEYLLKEMHVVHSKIAESQIFLMGKEKDFQSLAAMSGSENIDENVKQIPVLNQYSDGTGSGFENCGFHALKNSLIAMVPENSTEEFYHLLNDKELFQVFYEKYCEHHLEGKKKGKRDASILLVRMILNEFIKDPSPPKNLIPLQQGLREGETPLFFQMTTTTGDDLGKPMFGFFDSAGALDSVALYTFAKEPGPNTRTIVLGNEMLGHWYTLIIHKNHEGKINILGCDSTGAEGATLGSFSPIGKMTALLQETINQPDLFILRAYGPIDDILSPRAGWINEDGSTSEEATDSLLESKDIMTKACVDAFDFFKQAELLGALDYNAQMKLRDLQKVVAFYTQSLPPDDPDLPQLKGIDKQLQKHQIDDYMGKMFSQALDVLGKYEGEVTKHQFTQTITAFTALRSLLESSKKFSDTASEEERIRKMNSVKGVSGVESGFVTGKSKNEIEGSLRAKIDTLFITYEILRKQGNLKRLFETIGSGDGCLTGRMERVMALRMDLAGMGGIEELTDAEKIKDVPVLALADILSFLDDEGAVRNFEIHHLKEEDNLDEFIENLRNYSTSDKAMHFKKFLLEKGIISSLEEIDWNDATLKILELPELAVWLKFAKIDAVKLL